MQETPDLTELLEEPAPLPVSPKLPTFQERFLAMFIHACPPDKATRALAVRKGWSAWQTSAYRIREGVRLVFGIEPPAGRPEADDLETLIARSRNHVRSVAEKAVGVVYPELRQTEHPDLSVREASRGGARPDKASDSYDGACATRIADKLRDPEVMDYLSFVHLRGFHAEEEAMLEAFYDVERAVAPFLEVKIDCMELGMACAATMRAPANADCPKRAVEGK
jgi:hypothetical protein